LKLGRSSRNVKGVGKLQVSFVPLHDATQQRLEAAGQIGRGGELKGAVAVAVATETQNDEMGRRMTSLRLTRREMQW
jgi:hypothetical protein